jgi:hypothetical protein
MNFMGHVKLYFNKYTSPDIALQYRNEYILAVKTFKLLKHFNSAN